MKGMGIQLGNGGIPFPVPWNAGFNNKRTEPSELEINVDKYPLPPLQENSN